MVKSELRQYTCLCRKRYHADILSFGTYILKFAFGICYAIKCLLLTSVLHKIVILSLGLFAVYVYVIFYNALGCFLIFSYKNQQKN